MALDNDVSGCDTIRLRQLFLFRVVRSRALEGEQERKGTSRMRGILSQSALSSTPEFVGLKVWRHLATCACRRTGSVQQTPEPPGLVQGRTQSSHLSRMLGNLQVLPL